MNFRLWSNDLKEGERMPEAQVFNGMGYTGGNRSPHLAWEGAPEGTKSFVVTAYDPDAPTGSGWWHWVVANIPATAKRASCGQRQRQGVARRSVTNSHGFRRAGLRRSRAATRAGSPLHFHAACAKS